MQKLKENDFVELDYTGRLKENNMIFDTTRKDIATKEGIFNPNMDYSPAVICIGQKQLISGLDEHLVGKEVGKEFEVELKPESAFGKKDAKLLKLISTAVFRKQNINPVPGMQVSVDNMMGLIRSVTGGRVYVDFNHPLSGKDVIYDVKLNKLITEDVDKIRSLMKIELKIKPEHVSFKEGKITVESKVDVPKELTDLMVKRIAELVPSAKELKFEVTKEDVAANKESHEPKA